jgi:hypothetical protein
MTLVSDAFTVLDIVTSVNNTAEKLLTSVNDTGKGNLIGIKNARKAILYWCQLHQHNITYAVKFAKIFKFKIDSTNRMTMTKIPNQSESEPF